LTLSQRAGKEKSKSSSMILEATGPIGSRSWKIHGALLQSKGDRFAKLFDLSKRSMSKAQNTTRMMMIPSSAVTTISAWYATTYARNQRFTAHQIDCRIVSVVMYLCSRSNARLDRSYTVNIPSVARCLQRVVSDHQQIQQFINVLI
jgi:hypothetical protein